MGRARWPVCARTAATRRKAGLPETVRFHELRPTAGTLALRQGMTLHAVSKMLGHADPAMSLRRYRPQQRSIQNDILQKTIAEISHPNGALSNTEWPLGTLR